MVTIVAMRGALEVVPKVSIAFHIANAREIATLESAMFNPHCQRQNGFRSTLLDRTKVAGATGKASSRNRGACSE